MGFLNIEDYILNTLIQSSYAKNALSTFIMYVLASITRFHINLFFCYLFSFGNRVDIWFPIVIAVVLSRFSDTIYGYVATHKSQCEDLADYIITNYSKKRFAKWKRCTLIVLFVYFSIPVFFVPIDNYFLMLAMFQTAAGFVICDLVENRLYIDIYNFFVNMVSTNNIKPDFSPKRIPVVVPVQKRIIRPVTPPRYSSDELKTPPKRVRQISKSMED